MRTRLFKPFSILLMAILAAACAAKSVSPTPATAEITFTAERSELLPGECTLLEWQVSGGFGVTLDDKTVDKTGKQEACPRETTRYTLAVDIGTSIETRLLTITVSGSGVGHEPTQAPTKKPSSGTTLPPEGVKGWVQLGGPPGGLGYDIRVDFTNPNIWYVTDAFAGVFRSTDDGSTWFPSNQGIIKETGLTNENIPVFSLTIDPHDSQILWIGTMDTGRIYRSGDGGQTWEERDTGITIDYTLLAFRGFTVDPRSSDIVYAMAETRNTTAVPICGKSNDCVGGMVYKTTDAGLHWEVIWKGDMPSSLARYLWINPKNPEILYVSTGIFDRGAIGEEDPYENSDIRGGLGVLKSMDGGETWRSLGRANGFDMLFIGSLYMHPEDPEILLAVAGHQKSQETVEQLFASGSAPGGIFRTTDGGELWVKVLASAYDVLDEDMSVVEICENDPDIAYAASSLAVYRSEDSGASWSRTAGGSTGWGSNGVLAGIPIDMQCDPRDSNRIFINNYNGGNFLSEDGGRTFVNASNGYSGSHSVVVVVDPNNAGHILTTGRSGPYTSTDYGATWDGIFYRTEKNDLTNGEGFAIAFDPADTQHLLYGDMFGHLEESFDGGLNWELRTWLAAEKNLPPGAHIAAGGVADITYAPSDPSLVYFGTTDRNCILNHELCGEGNGMFFSIDGGTTWQGTSDQQLWQQMVVDIAVHPAEPRTLFAAASQGLYHSTDGGQSWQKVQGLPDGNARAVSYDPSDPNTLLAAVKGAGIYRSRDGGITWEPALAGLEPNGSIHSIVFDSTNGQLVYASDHFSGVYRSTDGGSTWTAFNDELARREVNALALSSDGKFLYVATIGSGIMRRALN
jgi:photosystem II stability/assembly factor-like uncharacterized protein